MRRAPFFNRRYAEGVLCAKKWYIKGQGGRPRGGASPYKNLLSTPHPPSRNSNWQSGLSSWAIGSFYSLSLPSDNLIQFFLSFIFFSAYQSKSQSNRGRTILHRLTNRPDNFLLADHHAVLIIFLLAWLPDQLIQGRADSHGASSV